jgi:hypothetical protein
MGYTDKPDSQLCTCLDQANIPTYKREQNNKSIKMTHALKTWPVYFKEIESGVKTFELRKADRPYNTGDSLILQEWDYEKGKYTGKELHASITYLLEGSEAEKFGLKKGYCILGIKEKE